MANLPYTRGVYTKLWLVAGLLWLCCQAAFGQCAANFSVNYFTSGTTSIHPLNNGGYVLSSAVHLDTVAYTGESTDFMMSYIYFDSCGNEQFRILIGDTTAATEGASVACITPDSGTLLTGYVTGTGQCGLGCGLLIRLDKFGKIVWQKTIGSFYENFGFYEAIYNPYNGHYYALATNDSRNLNAFLYSLMEIDSAGNILNTATFIAGKDTSSTQGFNSIHILEDSTIGVAGYYTSRTAGTVPVFYTYSPDLEPLRRDSFLWDLGSNFNGVHIFTQRKLRDKICLVAVIDDTIVGLGTSIFEVKIDGSLQLLNKVNTLYLGRFEPSLNGNWLTNTERGIILYNGNYQQIEDKQMPEANDYIVSSAIQLRSGSYVMSGYKKYFSPQGEVIAQRPHVWQTDQRGWNVGIEQQAKPKSTSVSIYPNPANHTVSIVGGQGAKVSISSITGQQVWNSLLTSNTIDIGHLPNGLYMVTVQLPNWKQSTHKLVVQH